MNRRDFFRDVLSAAALAWGAPLVRRLTGEDAYKLPSPDQEYVFGCDLAWDDDPILFKVCDGEAPFQFVPRFLPIEVIRREFPKPPTWRRP